jgi:hypothetical protein
MGKVEYKRAIDLLSTASEEDISSMEPEFFMAYARFSEVYKKHVEKQVAEENAKDWGLSKLPPCPNCGKKTITICTPKIDLSNLDIYVYPTPRRISFGLDEFDTIYFNNPVYEELAEVVRTNAPDIAYLLEEHLCCYECDITYPASKELRELIGKEVEFGTIVEWAKTKQKED